MDPKTLATLKEGYIKAGLPSGKVDSMIHFLSRFYTFTQAREHLLKQKAFWEKRDAERDARASDNKEALRLSMLRDDPPMLKWKGKDYPDWSGAGSDVIANEWAKSRGYNAFWAEGAKGEKKILKIWQSPDDDRYYQNLPWQKDKPEKKRVVIEEEE